MTVSPEILAASILVVDDLESDLRLVESMLGGAGFSRISRTRDPREVCELHRRNRYDLIILDLLMPDMDGFQVMEGLKQIEPGGYLPVLAVTASRDLMARALESGARDYIDKPLGMGELLARVRSLVEVSLFVKQKHSQTHALTRSLQERTERLWEQAELFRLFAAHVPEGLLLRGVSDRIVRYVNPAWSRITGVALAVGDEIEKAVEAIHPLDRDYVLREMAKHPEGGMELEARFAVPGAAPRWCHIRNFAIADAGGKPLWVAGIIEDITARKNLEEQTRLQATLVEQSIVGIYVVEGGCFTYANPRMCEMLGYAVEDLIGIATIELVIEEDRARLIENRRRRDAGDAGALMSSYRMRRRDGGIVHLAVDGRVLQQGGHEVLFGISHDITERVRAQELLAEAESHYRALVEQSIVGIYLLHGKDLLYANPRMCEMLGYTLGELAGIKLADIVDPEDHPLIDEVVTRRRAGDTGPIGMQCRARHRDGRLVHLAVETKIIDLAGRKAAIGVVQDVTDREAAAQALRESEERYRQRVLGIQEEERRAISLELHDDVGQSLIALKIGLHRLGLGLEPAKTSLLSECMTVADSVREKVRELATQLHPPQLAPLGLHDALRGLVHRQRDMTGLAIRYTFDGLLQRRLPDALEGACYRICQEALSNATRHANANVIDVELAALQGELRLEIRDDGVGFDRQADRDAILKSGSLGLISMQERARLAGGSLEVRSAPGSGTRVRAVFPT